LHATDRDKAGQATPPLADGVMTVRDCACWPPPHDAEQTPNAPNSLTTQSTTGGGHSCALQRSICVRGGQAAPPKAGDVTTVRVDVTEPPPHALSHMPSTKALTTQSTGHGCSLHFWVCVKAGQAAPPLAVGVTTVATAVCVPPPHVAEHVENAPNALMTQLTGHGCELHVCVCTKTGQAAPPLAADVNTDRVDVCTPDPHGVEHAPYGDHSLTTQSTTHFWLLHSTVEVKAGQAAPPKAAGVTTDTVT